MKQKYRFERVHLTIECEGQTVLCLGPTECDKCSFDLTCGDASQQAFADMKVAHLPHLEYLLSEVERLTAVIGPKATLQELSDSITSQLKDDTAPATVPAGTTPQP